MDLKIGRHTYTITEHDLFFDNGACVQLLSQSRESSTQGHRPTPVLSKKAVREIGKHKRIQKKHYYGDKCQLFRLKFGESI